MKRIVSTSVFVGLSLLLSSSVGAQVVEPVPFEMVRLTSGAQSLSFDVEDPDIPEVPGSCLDILHADPSAVSGEYEIETIGGPVVVHCDMETDGGGYTTLAIDEGVVTARAIDENDCHAFGMDIVVPRTRAHWASLLTLYDTSYFSTVPGIFKPDNGGNFTIYPMNSDGVPPGTWQALDGREWWLRDTSFTEPNGDYQSYCWLSMNYWVLDDLRFNDGTCAYSTGRYICSTNDKTSITGDEFSGWLDLGFEFVFFGQTFERVRVSSNGRLSFDSRDGACCGNDVVPSRVLPNNLIAGYWAHLDPETEGRVRVQRFGEAPERRFVVEYRGVVHAASGGEPVTFQVVLEEAGDRVEIHCEDCPSGGLRHTQGVEGPEGVAGLSLPGRNLAVFDLQRDGVAYLTNEAPPDGESWSVVGQVLRDEGDETPIVVVAYADEARSEVHTQVVVLQAGIYSLPGLRAGSYYLRAFEDDDGNGLFDEGERALVPEGAIVLPPDALGVDFDLRTEVVEPPDAGVDAPTQDTGEPLEDAGDEGVEDVVSEDAPEDAEAPPDEEEDPVPEPESSGEGGCATSPGSPASQWWLCFAALLWWRRGGCGTQRRSR